MRRLKFIPAMLFAVALVGGLQLAACSSTSCVTGARVYCTCPGGSESTQTCQPNGAFGACVCGGTTGGTSNGTSGTSGGIATASGTTGGNTTGPVATSSSGTAAGTSSATGATSNGGNGISSGSTGGTTSAGTTSGGSGGNLTCSAPLDTPGTCSWPEFCVSGHCLAPQNMDAQGDDTPSVNCQTSAATVQGAGNLDDDREGGGIDLPVAGSPIITDLQQVPVQSNQDCVANIGSNATEYEESARACAGGTVDPGGSVICAADEAALLFQGGAFDPNSAFAATEGVALDAQFYWVTSSAAPTSLADSAFGAAQSGFIIPGAGWTSAGGRFVLVQCLSKANYPLAINSYPVTLHFADTGTDAGLPGNSFCAQWLP